MTPQMTIKPIRGKDLFGHNCVHAYKIALSNKKKFEIDPRYLENMRDIQDFIDEIQEDYEYQVSMLEMEIAELKHENRSHLRRGKC